MGLFLTRRVHLPEFHLVHYLRERLIKLTEVAGFATKESSQLFPTRNSFSEGWLIVGVSRTRFGRNTVRNTARFGADNGFTELSKHPLMLRILRSVSVEISFNKTELLYQRHCIGLLYPIYDLVSALFMSYL